MKYRVSPNVVYKLRGEVENIVRRHNYIGKHGRKRYLKKSDTKTIKPQYRMLCKNFYYTTSNNK